MLRKPRVYTASKLDVAPQFRKLRDNLPYMDHIEFTSRWLDMAHLETKGTPSVSEYTYFWTIDVADVLRSDILLVYGGTGLELRGALVEVGVALGAHMPVVITGTTASFGTWCHHPQVLHASTIENGLDIIIEWAKQWKETS